MTQHSHTQADSAMGGGEFAREDKRFTGHSSNPATTPGQPAVRPSQYADNPSDSTSKTNDVPVMLQNRLVRTVDVGTGDWTPMQFQVGAANQDQVVQILGADPARTKVTITNIGATNLCIGKSKQMNSQFNSFILAGSATPAAGAAITLRYKGAIFAMAQTAGQLCLGQISSEAEGTVENA